MQLDFAYPIVPFFLGITVVPREIKDNNYETFSGVNKAQAGREGLVTSLLSQLMTFSSLVKFIPHDWAHDCVLDS